MPLAQKILCLLRIDSLLIKKIIFEAAQNSDLFTDGLLVGRRQNRLLQGLEVDLPHFADETFRKNFGRTPLLIQCQAPLNDFITKMEAREACLLLIELAGTIKEGIELLAKRFDGTLACRTGPKASWTF